MTRASVYLETSVISYTTSRPSRDLVMAARQQITRDWFASRSDSYDLFVSQLVVTEVSGGDEAAAGERVDFLTGIHRLAITEAAGTLAEQLVSSRAVPAEAAEDALHIALSAVHGIEYLLTWNCKHIANAATLPEVYQLMRHKGYTPPLIVTPEEFSGYD